MSWRPVKLELSQNVQFYECHQMVSIMVLLKIIFNSGDECLGDERFGRHEWSELVKLMVTRKGLTMRLFYYMVLA